MEFGGSRSSPKEKENYREKLETNLDTIKGSSSNFKKY